MAFHSHLTVMIRTGRGASSMVVLMKVYYSGSCLLNIRFYLTYFPTFVLLRSLALISLWNQSAWKGREGYVG